MADMTEQDVAAAAVELLKNTRVTTLAQVVGVSKSTLSNIAHEKGKYRLRLGKERLDLAAGYFEKLAAEMTNMAMALRASATVSAPIRGRFGRPAHNDG